MTILAQLTSDDVLDTAYEWLCRRRRDYSANADVWSLRRCWPHEKEQIKDELRSGSYRFSLLSRVTLRNGEDTDLWSARDALVLKALALVLAKQTIANFIEKASRLYEQERRAASAASPLEMYVRRWLRWTKGGVW